MKKLNQLSSSNFLKLLFLLLTLAFFLAALIMPDRATMFDGLKQIATAPVKIGTNLFSNGGYAGTFLNAAMICMICSLLFFLPQATANAASVIAFLLTAGFAFWGINIINVWFGIPGVLLYCLVKKEAPGKQVNAMIFTTGLAPLISDLLLRYPHADPVGFRWQGILLALAVGLFIGFCLPAGLTHSPSIHKGYSIYSAAMPIGILAFFLRGILYQVLGGNLSDLKVLTDAGVSSANVTNAFCGAAFALCIVVAFLMGCRPKDYWELMKDSGPGADYVSKYGNATFLMNVGVFGLFILAYYNIIGATFNAITLGCIFCMLSTCCSGSHPRNVLPIILGYVIASFVCQWLFLGSGEYAQAINAQSIVIGLCFANGLSPIAGKYGWFFGIPAGILHFLLVTSVPLLHGGFCLYNGGFTACFVCILFVPMLERFFRTKEERLAAKVAK